MSLCFAFLSCALWRWTFVTREMLETRRHGLMMEHLDWTRTVRPSRTGPRKRGLLASLLGN
jgi:hypothetical protein